MEFLPAHLAARRRPPDHTLFYKRGGFCAAAARAVLLFFGLEAETATGARKYFQIKSTLIEYGTG